MATPLDLSLPAPPRQRYRSGLIPWLTLLATLIVIVLIVVERMERSTPAEAANNPAAADRLKNLAIELEKRTLYVQAEQVWAEHMALAKLTPQEQADLVYRRGKCLKEGGKYAEAARSLSEVDSFPVTRDEKRRARQLLVECLDALGKRDVRDSLSRAFAVGEETQGTAVARIGEEVVTKEELRAELLGEVSQSLRLDGAPFTPGELEKKTADIVDKEMKDPETLRRVTQQAISRRVLYLEGLERGFADDAASLEAIARFRRDNIANRVIEAEAENALKSLGPTEIRNHYEANKSKFLEKAGVEFSFARFPGPAEAEVAIEKLKDPSRASEVKLEPAAGIASSGEPVPEIGLAPEVTAHLLALGVGEVSRTPIEVADAYHVFKVTGKRPERQLTAEEAEPRVRADLAQLKRKEAMDNLRTLLSQKFRVEMLDSKEPPQQEPPSNANQEKEVAPKKP